MHVFKDRVVTLEYKITDQQGVLIDSTDDGESLSIIQGRGTIFPALEKAIEGRSTGEQLELHLTPQEAFGERDESLVKEVPKSQLNVPDGISVGMQLRRRQGDHTIPLLVTKVSDDKVTLDANHPYAGQALDISLVIVEVREALVEELESGVIQEMDDIYEREKSDSVLVDFKP